MQTYISSVSPKGQVTIPKELRDLLRVKPKDKVSFQMDKQAIKIMPASSSVDAIFQKVPALKKPLTFKQITQIAKEEHVKEVTHEGM